MTGRNLRLTLPTASLQGCGGGDLAGRGEQGGRLRASLIAAPARGFLFFLGVSVPWGSSTAAAIPALRRLGDIWRDRRQRQRVAAVHRTGWHRHGGAGSQAPTALPLRFAAAPGQQAWRSWISSSAAADARCCRGGDGRDRDSRRRLRCSTGAQNLAPPAAAVQRLLFGGRPHQGAGCACGSRRGCRHSALVDRRR